MDSGPVVGSGCGQWWSPNVETPNMEGRNVPFREGAQGDLPMAYSGAESWKSGGAESKAMQAGEGGYRYLI